MNVGSCNPIGAANVGLCRDVHVGPPGGCDVHVTPPGGSLSAGLITERWLDEHRRINGRLIQRLRGRGRSRDHRRGEPDPALSKHAPPCTSLRRAARTT